MHFKKTVITQKMTNAVRQTDWLLYYVKLV